MKLESPRTAGLALLSLLTVAPGALAWRDPLEPPSPAPASPTAAAAPQPEPPAPLPAVRHIVSVEGTRYLVVGARRFAAGERWGALHIECIHERGVFVRDAGNQRLHLPLLASVPVRPDASAGCAAPAQPPTTVAQRAAKRNPQ
jgi:hypothetical protein